MSSLRLQSLLGLSVLISSLCLCCCGARGQGVLVQYGSEMKYQVNTAPTDVDSTWFDSGFNDSETGWNWADGQYGVGYDTNGDANSLLQTTVGSDARSVYTRAHFTITEGTTVSNVFLGVDFDDGYAAWIDDKEVYRDNVPEGLLAGDTNALVNHESSNGIGPNYEPLRDITTASKDLLTPGDHVLAIGVWNIHGTSSDLVLVPRLSINEPNEIIKGPYLQNVGLDPLSGFGHITVMWETSTEGPSRVDYWTPQYSHVVEHTNPVTIHEVTLSDLSPGTEYHYKVTSGDISSADNAFLTALPAGWAFRFVAYGDSRDGSDNYEFHTLHQEVVTNIIASDPDIVVHTGDIVYNGGNYAEWGPQFFGPAAELIKNTTIFPSLGNHEYNRDGLQTYRDFFSLPSVNERWYSFDYGCAHFICLDTNIVTDYATNSEQRLWLESDLAAASESAPWIFVFFHHPPYSRTETHSDDLNVQTYLVPLFEEYGVTMVFNGHSHAYERYFNNGVYYIVTGGGGAPLHNLTTDNQEPIRQVGESCFHHCTVDISGNQLVFRAVRNNGSDIDRVEIPDATPPAAPTALTAVAGDSQVQLDWDDNTEVDLWGYNVYGSAGEDYALIASLVPSSDYLDTGLNNGTTYYYYVTAVDNGSNESDASNEASATPEANYDAYVSQDPIVTYGVVGGDGIAGTMTAGDGLVQTITEVPNGKAGASSLQAEYVLHTTANPAQVTELVLHLDAIWTALDGDADPLVVSTWDGSVWQDITADILADGLFSPGTPQGYIDDLRNIYVLFTDTEPIRKEKKDALTIDLLYAHILAGPPDTDPPAAPQGLTATAGDTVVDLDWDDNTEPDLDGYYVYRSQSYEGPYSPITAELVSSSSYQDTGLTDGVTYYYKVSAVDFSGNESALSETASATPVDLPPSAPTSLVATPGNGQVTLDWDDNAEADLAGYNVYRSQGGSYAIIGSAGGSDYLDSGLGNGITYYYAVTAVDDGGNESGYSNEVSATPTEQQTIHVENIVMDLVPAGRNWKAEATVLIHDQSGAPQAGAAVSGEWYFEGSLIQAEASGTTDDTGNAVIVSPPKKAVTGETFTFVVTDVALTGYLYDPTSGPTGGSVTVP